MSITTHIHYRVYWTRDERPCKNVFIYTTAFVPNCVVRVGNDVYAAIQRGHDNRNYLIIFINHK